MNALGFGLLLCLDVMTLTLTYSVVVIQIKNLWSFAVVRFQPLAARQEVMKNQKKRADRHLKTLLCYLFHCPSLPRCVHHIKFNTINDH